MTAIGVVLRAAVAFELTRLMGYLIYKVSPRDPLAFGSATVIIAVAALAACLVLRGVQRGPIQFGRCGVEPVFVTVPPAGERQEPQREDWKESPLVQAERGLKSP